MPSYTAVGYKLVPFWRLHMYYLTTLYYLLLLLLRYLKISMVMLPFTSGIKLLLTSLLIIKHSSAWSPPPPHTCMVHSFTYSNLCSKVVLTMSPSYPPYIK